MSELERVTEDILEAIGEGESHNYPEYIIRADIIGILKTFESKIRAKVEYELEVKEEWN